MKSKKLQEDEYVYELQLCGPFNFSFEDDMGYCRANAIFRHIFPYRYCCCGKLQSIYRNKLTNDYLELGKDAIYVTKKSLMLNHLLGITDTAASKAVSDITSSKLHRKAIESEANDGSLYMAKVQDNTRSVCLTSSLFLDKRVFSLFRSIALYWFFCLNTVFAKSNDGFKKRILPYDFATFSSSSFDFNLKEFNLSILPEVLDDLRNVNEDFFWEVISNFILLGNEDCGTGSVLLSFDEHSQRRLYSELLKKMLTYVLHRLCRFIEHAENLMNVSSTPLVMEVVGGNDGQLDRVTDGVRYGNSFDPGFDLVYEFDVHMYDDVVRSEEIQEGRGTGNEVDETVVLGYGERENLLEDSVSEDESSISFSTQLMEYDSDVEGWASDDERSDDEIKSEDTITYTVVNEENYYFLPGDLFVAEEIDYPEYNIWCSPLFVGFLPQPLSVPNCVPRPESKINTDSYKTYSLWQSSTVMDDERVPNFYFSEELSVFSIPYSPNVGDQANVPESTYSLWGSPNIIECLSDIRCKQQAEENWSNDNFSPDFSHFEFMRKSFDEADWQFGDYSISDKYLNLKPVMNRFVSFTDRGAFKYYKKFTPHVEYPLQKVKNPPTRVCDYSDPFFVETKPIIVPVEREQQPSQPNKPSEEPLEYELNPDHFFKPIQPAFRVVTDIPAVIERSSSATYYVQAKKYRTFRHELDHQRDHNEFLPKYEVNTNNKACQTEDTMYLNRWNSDMIYEDRMKLYGPLPFQEDMRNDQVPYNTAFFYTLEEVFNVFEKSDMGNLGLTSSVPEFDSLF